MYIVARATMSIHESFTGRSRWYHRACGRSVVWRSRTV